MSRHYQHSFLILFQGIVCLLREKTPVDMRNTWFCIDWMISHTSFQWKYQKKPSAHQSASIWQNRIPSGWKHKKHCEHHFLGLFNEMTDHLRVKTQEIPLTHWSVSDPQNHIPTVDKIVGKHVIFKGVPWNNLLALGKKYNKVPLAYHSASNSSSHVQSVGEKDELTL